MVRRAWISLLVLGIGLVLFGLMDAWLNALRLALLPKNFAPVTPGILYRSGQVRPDDFRKAMEKHGIRTVICLNVGEEPTEETTCRTLGIEFRTYRMPGNGLGEPEYFHEIVDLLADRSRHPVLIHCNAGAYRTGVAVAMFRIVHQGWTFEDAVLDMRYRGFRNEPATVEHLRAVLESYPRRSDEGLRPTWE